VILEAFTLGSLFDQPRTTLGVMDDMVERWHSQLVFVMLARRIAQAAGAHDPRAEVEAIRRWVKGNITYRRDPLGTEWLQDPVVTLAERAGDCDDMATLAGTLLAALGHTMRAKGVVWKGQPTPSHAVMQDEETGLVVDPVAPFNVSALAWPPKPYVVERLATSWN